MRYLLIPILCLLLVPFVLGHLAAGEDRTVGDVEIDLGYAPDDLTTGVPSTLTIGLATAGVPTSDPVWVRISRGDVVSFSSELVPTGGAVSLSYEFPTGGTYEITVRGEGVETTFALKVASALPWLWMSITGALGLLAGLLIGWKLQK